MQGKVATERRRDPSVSKRHQILMEADYKCGNPRCNHILTLEIHHVVWVKDGGGNDPRNLLALCPNCHALHTRGHIPQIAIRHWKGMLLALNHAFDRTGMDLLLFLHHTQNQQVWYSGDGVLRFAGLIAADLVEIKETNVNRRVPTGHGMVAKFTTSTHSLKLSETGALLIEAWLAGDEEKYRKLVMETSKGGP